MKQALLNFNALLLTSLAVLAAADVTGELVLSQDFRMGEGRRMPNPRSSPSLRSEKRDYPGYDAGEWQVQLRAPANE